MTEQRGKQPGRLAKAVVTVRIAAAALTPIGGAVAPVPSQGAIPPQRKDVPAQQVKPSAEEQLGRAQNNAERERRRQGLEAGYQLREPDTVLDPTKRSRQRRGR